MSKVRALNRNGKVTWCTAQNPGSGNCNHVLHQINGMTDEQFIQKADDYNEKLFKEREKRIEKHIQQSTLSDIERRKLKQNGGLDVFEELYNDNGVGLTNENVDVILQDSSHTKLASSLKDYLETHEHNKLIMIGLEKRHQHYFGKDVTRGSDIKYFNNIGFYVVKI